MNDSKNIMNRLIEVLDSEEYVCFNFERGIIGTHLESLPENFQESICDTLYTFVDYKDESIATYDSVSSV